MKSLNRKLKKAFTLVELVVVIAIIAILSTVSVVTYFGVTNSAKASVDNTLITELNKCLQLDEVLNGKPATPTDALEIVEENGFTIEKMTPTQDNKEIVWHQDTNKFELVDAITDNINASVDAWRFLSDYSDNNGYSVYLKDDSTAISLDITTGLDVGKNTNITNISYVNSSLAQNVIIRTNGGKLNINAPEDIINHYGDVENLNIVAVDLETSYHEFGRAGYVALAKGHFVCESNGIVMALVASGSNTEVKVDKANNADIKLAYTTKESSENKNHGGNILLTYKAEFADENNETLKEIIYNAEATIVNAISVNGVYYKTMETAFNRVNSGVSLGYEIGGKAEIILHKDIVDIGNVFAKGCNVIFDLNGHSYTIKGAVGSTNTETNAFQLLANSTVVIKNGTLRIDESNLVERKDGHSNIKRFIQDYAALTLEDVTIDTTNLYGTGNCPLSFNNQPVNIIGNTNIILKDSATVAFDADGNWSGYDRCKVTINTTGTIDGFIELGSGYLNIQKIGSVAGIKFCTSCGESETKDQYLRIEKSPSVNIAAPDGYVWNAAGTGLEIKSN